jgi:ATP synthase F0 subunit b
MSLLAVVRVLAEESGKTETPHSWWPEPYEIIWGSLATVVIFAALWKFAIPQLRNALTARTERIQRDLDNSARALADAEASAAQIRASKGDLGAERTRILADAERTAERVLTDGRQRIANEVAEAHAKATADIGLARSRVSAELQADVSQIAAAATEHVVNGSLDGTTQQRLIEDFIAKVGARA